MSQECYDRLVAEIRELVNVELPKAKEELVEARAKGDPEREFRVSCGEACPREAAPGKIRFKQRVLEYARVLDTSALDCDAVGLLRKVWLTNLNTNASMTYTIVNPHEANLSEGKLSIKSPIAEALVGRHKGDVVEAHVPMGIIRLRIDNITI